MEAAFAAMGVLLTDLPKGMPIKAFATERARQARFQLPTNPSTLPPPRPPRVLSGTPADMYCT